MAEFGGEKKTVVKIEIEPWMTELLRYLVKRERRSGVEIVRFAVERFDPEASRKFREKWGVDQEALDDEFGIGKVV